MKLLIFLAVWTVLSFGFAFSYHGVKTLYIWNYNRKG